MDKKDYVNGLFDFIEKSPTVFHTAASVKQRLVEAGYTELSEGEKWTLSDGGKHFVMRNGSSIIAFNYKSLSDGLMICASHSDFPALRVKVSGTDNGAYVRLPVERYGGMIMYSWLDRPLSIAGRVAVKDGGGIRRVLFNIDRDLLVIPSVAIHLNRTVNEKFAPNPAVDLIPLLADGDKKRSLNSIIAEEMGICECDIVSHDLFLYVRARGTRVGIDGEFAVAPRLDNLACAYASTEAFLECADSTSIPVLAVFDNEEVGSETKQGAASDFLYSTLMRIAGGSEEEYRRLVFNGLMLSADNAHALHPNHPELSDAGNAPRLNGGIVIKHNANQKYTTDAMSEALFSLICEGAGVRTQSYYNRADIPGGSTLGSISNARVPVSTVDIGLPQLAMHSAVETVGAGDVCEMVRAITAVFSSAAISTADGVKVK